MNRIAFEVSGYPPAKSDGLFILDASHPHAPRVDLLLETASKAQIEQVFKPIEEEWVKLDVMLFDATGQDPYDATSYLSGIVEALEEKSVLGGIEHLGELSTVWLYQNSLQVRKITYRRAEASKTLYAITVESRALRQAH
jgi:hypothetical protein